MYKTFTFIGGISRGGLVALAPGFFGLGVVGSR